MFITAGFVPIVTINQKINFEKEYLLWQRSIIVPYCGYESDEPIEKCPICGAAMKEREEGGEMAWAAEHIVGVAQGVSDYTYIY